MNYTCRLCGKTLDSKKSDWFYFLDGVACTECIEEQDKETEEEIENEQ